MDDGSKKHPEVDGKRFHEAGLMSILLGLDIGEARTGIAFADDKNKFVAAIKTIAHKNVDELSSAIAIIAKEKNASALIIGLPLLPSGEEGKQVAFVRSAAKTIGEKTGLPIHFLDERYTTSMAKGGLKTDPDARAACELLNTFLDQNNAIDR